MQPNNLGNGVIASISRGVSGFIFMPITVLKIRFEVFSFLYNFFSSPKAIIIQKSLAEPEIFSELREFEAYFVVLR